jgi:hypothetical protein
MRNFVAQKNGLLAMTNNFDCTNSCERNYDKENFNNLLVKYTAGYRHEVKGLAVEGSHNVRHLPAGPEGTPLVQAGNPPKCKDG